jgi:hypothetical protein
MYSDLYEKGDDQCQPCNTTRGKCINNKCTCDIGWEGTEDCNGQSALEIKTGSAFLVLKKHNTIGLNADMTGDLTLGPPSPLTITGVSPLTSFVTFKIRKKHGKRKKTYTSYMTVNEQTKHLQHTTDTDVNQAAVVSLSDNRGSGYLVVTDGTSIYFATAKIMGPTSIKSVRVLMKEQSKLTKEDDLLSFVLLYK